MLHKIKPVTRLNPALACARCLHAGGLSQLSWRNTLDAAALLFPQTPSYCRSNTCNAVSRGASNALQASPSIAGIACGRPQWPSWTCSPRRCLALRPRQQCSPTLCRCALVRCCQRSVPVVLPTSLTGAALADLHCYEYICRWRTFWAARGRARATAVAACWHCCSASMCLGAVLSAADSSPRSNCVCLTPDGRPVVLSVKQTRNIQNTFSTVG